FPGGLSALGILRADVAQDFSRTMLLPVRNRVLAFREAQQVLRKLRRDGENALQREGFPRKQQRFEYRLDLRYIGQAYDLSIPATHDFVSAFHHAHERAYGHSDSHKPVEIVNVRCRATGFSRPIELPRIGRVSNG